VLVAVGERPNGVYIRHATVCRTARRLFQGEALYRAPSRQAAE